MAGVEQVDRLLARLHNDLRHESRVLLLGEERLDAVGLRADAVDQADVLAVRAASML